MSTARPGASGSRTRKHQAPPANPHKQTKSKALSAAKGGRSWFTGRGGIQQLPCPRHQVIEQARVRGMIYAGSSGCRVVAVFHKPA